MDTGPINIEPGAVTATAYQQPDTSVHSRGLGFTVVGAVLAVAAIFGFYVSTTQERISSQNSRLESDTQTIDTLVQENRALRESSERLYAQLISSGQDPADIDPSLMPELWCATGTPQTITVRVSTGDVTIRACVVR